MDLHNEHKMTELLEIFRQRPVDETKLKCFGRTHGFCNFYGRNLAWPELVKSLPSHKSSGDHLAEKDHKYRNQIHIDVERALTSFDYYSKLTPEEISYHKSILEDILQSFFTKFKDANYFQGFHDITTVFMFALGKDQALRVLEKAAFTYYHDALMYPFEQSVSPQLKLVFLLISRFDHHLYQILSTFYEMPMFAIPWLLTWFSHSVSNIEYILRIYDYLLSSPSYSIIYMCAALILISKADLLASAEEVDIGDLHTFYQNIKITDVEKLLSATMKLEEEYPFAKLVSEQQNFPENLVVFRQRMILPPRDPTIKSKEQIYRFKFTKFSDKKKITKTVIMRGITFATIVVVLTYVYQKYSVKSLLN